MPTIYYQSLPATLGVDSSGRPRLRRRNRTRKTHRTKYSPAMFKVKQHITPNRQRNTYAMLFMQKALAQTTAVKQHNQEPRHGHQQQQPHHQHRAKLMQTIYGRRLVNQSLVAAVGADNSKPPRPRTQHESAKRNTPSQAPHDKNKTLYWSLLVVTQPCIVFYAQDACPSNIHKATKPKKP